MANEISLECSFDLSLGCSFFNWVGVFPFLFQSFRLQSEMEASERLGYINYTSFTDHALVFHYVPVISLLLSTIKQLMDPPTLWDFSIFQQWGEDNLSQCMGKFLWYHMMRKRFLFHIHSAALSTGHPSGTWVNAREFSMEGSGLLRKDYSLLLNKIPWKVFSKNDHESIRHVWALYGVVQTELCD